MSSSLAAPAPRVRIPFSSAMLGRAINAVMDLNDPLRSNVKLSWNNTDMFADLSAIKRSVETGQDASGAAQKILNAWESVLSGGQSPDARLDAHLDARGLLHINLLRMPQLDDMPNLSITT